MPKYRQLHTKILDSFDFAEMPTDFFRVVWMLLPLIVDSQGRGIDSPAWIRSRMFPLRTDVTLEDIDAAFDWFAARMDAGSGKGMIVRYTCAGKKYFYIPTFASYQSGTHKEAKSLLPDPEQGETGSGPAPEESETASASDSDADANTDPKADAKPAAEKPNIFKLYSNEIGPITSLIADELQSLEEYYSAEWIETAIREAVLRNARNLAYITAILKRWQSEGFQSKGKQRANASRGEPALTEDRIAAIAAELEA